MSSRRNYDIDKNRKRGAASEDRELECLFYEQPEIIAPYTMRSENLRSDCTSSAHLFVPNSSMDLLLYTTLEVITGHYVSSEGNDICFPPNPFYNIIKEVQLLFEGGSITLDTIALDCLSKAWSIANTDAYSYALGNRASLLSASQELKPQRLSLIIPWSFSKRTSTPLPLFLMRDKKISFGVILRNSYAPTGAKELSQTVVRMIGKYIKCTPEMLEYMRQNIQEVSIQTVLSYSSPLHSIRIDSDIPIQYCFVVFTDSNGQVSSVNGSIAVDGVILPADYYGTNEPQMYGITPSIGHYLIYFTVTDRIEDIPSIMMHKIDGIGTELNRLTMEVRAIGLIRLPLDKS